MWNSNMSHFYVVITVYDKYFTVSITVIYVFNMADTVRVANTVHLS